MSERPGRTRARRGKPGSNAGTSAAQEPKYVLRLFVAGMNPRSLRAIENMRRVCEEHMAGAYELRVIDIYDTPEMAEEGQVIAAPTLVKQLPEPLRRLVGDLADEGRVLLALGLKAPEK